MNRSTNFILKGDVEYVKLGDICSIVTKKNTNSEESLFLTNSAKKGIMSQVEYFEGANIASLDNIKKYTIVEIGDFVYNPRKSKYAPFGPVKINNFVKGVISPLYMCFRLDETSKYEVSKTYISYLFESTSWHKHIYQNGDTGTRHDRVSISGKEFLNLPIMLPIFKVQIQIGNLLASIDNLIELKKDTKLNLVLKKKYYLNEIFGDAHNKIKDDIKLQDLIEYVNTNKCADTSKYIKITCSLHKKGIKFLGETSKRADTRPFYIRRTGEILIGKQNYFKGSIAIITECFDQTICSNALISFMPSSKVDTKYLFELLSEVNFLKRRSALANGTGQKELSEKELLNFDLKIHSYDEQIKIGNILCAMDKLIELKNDEIKELELKKKYYLKEMFS